ncbi:MAG TPA: FHA domain-containing protein, partial [Ktedonobacterales bacterium]
FFPPETVVAFNTLLGVNYFFIIVGDVILGLSIFRAAIFPRWTGVAFIAIGCAELIVTLVPVVALLQVAVVALAIALFAQLGLTLLKPSPALPLAPTAPAMYGAPVPVGTPVPAAPAMYGAPAAAPPAPVYAPQPPAPAAPPHERPMLCPQCRTPQASGARVCSRCGFNFSQAQLHREQTPPAAASPPDLPDKTVLKPQPVVTGPQGVFTLPAGRQVFITAAGAMVGRGPVSGPDAVDVDLTSEAEKATVSRHHARVTWSEGHFEIEDLKSANQTRLNPQTLVPGQRYPLHNGDVVDFGSVRCRFTLQGS